MDAYSWDQVAKQEVAPGIQRQIIHTPSMTILRLNFKQGAIVATHSHVHEQVSMLINGKMRFLLDSEEKLSQAGDILRIPSNVPHSAEAIEDALLIDIFTPARTDWQ